MTHFSDGELQAWLDGELKEEDTREMERHLRSCPECMAVRNELDSAGRMATLALTELDTLPDPVVSRAGSEEQLRAIRDRAAARRHRRARRRWALAASVILALAASLAVPASPLRAWLIRAWEQVVFVFQGPAAEPASPQGGDAAPESSPDPVRPSDPPADEPLAATVEAGLHANAVDLPVEILLNDLTPGAEIRVIFVGGTQAGVFAAVDSRFTTGPGRLEAWVSGGQARVEVPRAARQLLLLGNGQPFLEKNGDSLSVRGPVLERDANGILFVIPGG